jgi:hypothetical protein
MLRRPSLTGQHPSVSVPKCLSGFGELLFYWCPEEDSKLNTFFNRLKVLRGRARILPAKLPAARLLLKRAL